MKDIHEMNEQELRALNKQVVSLIRQMVSKESIKAAASFHIGQRVSFMGKVRGRSFATCQIGKVTAINSKTIGVLTDEGLRWRVAPQFLSDASTVSALKVA